VRAMRRYPFAIALCLLVLTLAAFSQQKSRPLTTEGLRTAQAPHRYEPPPPNATAEELEARGDEFRVEKAYADAVDYYRAGLAKTRAKPEQAQLYNKVGIAELQVQHYKEAQKNFEHALKAKGEMAEARNNLGAAFFLQKKYGKAVKEYKEALKLRDADASFHSNLGTAYFIRKEYQLAMAEYMRAFQLDPTVFERSSQSGVSAQLSTSENRAQYSYLLAKMYAQVGDLDHCILYLKKAMEDGYKEIDNVYKDQEFTVLRKDPRFPQLMGAKPAAIPE
jgi:tetratricopeptide (TPR) repeat protein